MYSILGAGPAGLTAGILLGRQATIYEKEASVGGLCSTLNVKDRFFFDIGGHSFHTPHQDVLDFVKAFHGDLHFQQRDAAVWHQGHVIPYPFQQHFRQIPDLAMIEECEQGLEMPRQHPSAARNFREYIYAKFGNGIANHFMIPYNEKVWGYALGRMSTEWTSERIADSKKGIFETSGEKRTALQPDTRVGYPRQGGFSSIFEDFARSCRQIRFNEEIVEIDLRDRAFYRMSNTALPAKGKTYYDKIISTLPLDKLILMCKGLHSSIKRRVGILRKSKLMIVCFGIEEVNKEVPHRLYIADPNVPTHKIAFNHTSSPWLKALGTQAVMCEVTVKRGMNTRDTIWKCEKFLKDAGFIKNFRHVTYRNVIYVPYGYPIYTHHRVGYLNEVLPILEQHGVYSIGRFGGWEYINSDAAIKRAIDLVERIKE